jgi:PAS domain S-box-containing protein
MTASIYNSQTIEATNQGTPKRSTPPTSSDQNTKLLALAEQVAHFGSWEWDVSKPRAVWSPEMFRIFGIEPNVEGLTLEEYQSYIHPDDLAAISKRMQASMVNVSLNQESKIDYRIIRHDGSVRVIHSQRQIRAVTPEGNLQVIVGVDQDVTEQKAAEEALKESEERFRIVAEAANVMVYEIDVATGNIRILRGVEELVGFTPQEVNLTVDWVISRMHPDDVVEVRKTLKEATTNPNIDRYVMEYRFLHKNGNYIILKDTAKAIKDQNGKTISFIGGIRDITQRRIDQKKNRAIQQTPRTTSRRTHQTTHNLRTIRRHRPSSRYGRPRHPQPTPDPNKRSLSAKNRLSHYTPKRRISRHERKPREHRAQHRLHQQNCRRPPRLLAATKTRIHPNRFRRFNHPHV